MRHSVRRALVVFAAGALSGCTTPATILRNPQTGQTVRCGGGVAGSLAGGVIGYSIEKSADERCVNSYVEQGFVKTP